MLTEIREKGRHALDNIPDEHIPTVARWLELLALHSKTDQVDMPMALLETLNQDMP